MLNRFVGSASIWVDHVKIVVGIGLISREFGEKLEAVHFVDRVAEVSDAACKIEYDDQCGIDLLGQPFSELCSLGFEGVCQSSELRRQPLFLTNDARF